MEWLGSNWIWLALGAGIAAFFVLGRGGCGMSHGGHEHHQGGEQDKAPREAASSETQGALGAQHVGHGSGPGQRRRHGGC